MSQTHSHVPAALDHLLQEMAEIKVSPTGERRVRVDLAADRLPTLLQLLKGHGGFLHLSAISCIDWLETNEFELVYHVWSYESRMLVSAHILIAKTPGRFVSVYDIHAPAGFFERDIHEMYGVVFEGAPNLHKFILTSWHGPPPMLKSFDTRAHVEATYTWREYNPQWLRDIEARGGGIED